MSRKNSFKVFEPENMESRIKYLGYTYFSYANDVLDRCVSATTLKRMADSGYASNDAVEKIMDKSPAYGSYILFGTPINGWTEEEPEGGKPLPKDVKQMLNGMATYIKMTSVTRKISKKRLMKELKKLTKDRK